MSQFKFPPISVLCGSTFKNYFKVLKQGRIDSRYYYKIFLTTLIVLISTPFHWWDKILFSKKLSKFKFEKPPLFIIGHWRSGTTLLHNMLCSDPDAGFLTTYYSLFPHNLGSKAIFKTFVKINIPEKRPSDNVKLGVNFPQEDEFAFANYQHNAYYNFFFFPNNYQTFYDKAVHHKGLTVKEKKLWFKKYDLMLKKALINSKGKRLIVKNPVNTARIKHILKLYPDAKFLYIYRNPITVYLSTEKFFINLLPTLQLQHIEEGLIKEIIFDIFKKLLTDYYEQRSLIPEKNLYVLKYEEFEKHPVEEIRRIYDNLLNEDFDSVKDYFSSYFNSIKGYQKNKYEVEKALIDEITAQFGEYMKKQGYSIPDDVIIK
jgi:hypothetical protein